MLLLVLLVLPSALLLVLVSGILIILMLICFSLSLKLNHLLQRISISMMRQHALQHLPEPPS